MTITKPLTLLKLSTLLALACLLSACGGSNSFPPVVTGVKVQSAQYGKAATIYLGGKDLRSNLLIDTSGACTNPTFASNSNTDTLLLNCVVAKTGDFSLVVQTAEGAAIYSTTVNIPLPQVALITAKGSITVELDPTLAPISTNNFLSYVNKGFYRDTLFHRVIPNFVVQGGGYTKGLVKKTEQSAPIELESNKGLSNVRGSLAMARTNLPNSATSEFYINLVDNLSLDYKNAANPGYAVFGKVVQGMDVVDAIAAEPTGVVGGFSDVPLADIALSLALQTK
jgi:cyclophilin family peptidyl-prolyl cis-trans isomerase